MSWSIAIIGKADNIVKALEDQSAKLGGQSKVEFDSVLPSLVGIVKENFGNENQIIKLTASGHGTASNGEQKQRQCVASIEMFYAQLV